MVVRDQTYILKEKRLAYNSKREEKPEKKNVMKRKKGKKEKASWNAPRSHI